MAVHITAVLMTLHPNSYFILMILDLTKAEMLVVSANPTLHDNFYIQQGASTATPSRTDRNLGVVLDDQLNFTDHIAKTANMLHNSLPPPQYISLKYLLNNYCLIYFNRITKLLKHKICFCPIFDAFDCQLCYTIRC